MSLFIQPLYRHGPLGFLGSKATEREGSEAGSSRTGDWFGTHGTPLNNFWNTRANGRRVIHSSAHLCPALDGPVVCPVLCFQSAPPLCGEAVVDSERVAELRSSDGLSHWPLQEGGFQEGPLINNRHLWGSSAVLCWPHLLHIGPHSVHQVIWGHCRDSRPCPHTQGPSDGRGQMQPHKTV